MRSAAIAGFLMAAALRAADPPVAIEYTCPAEDVDGFALVCSSEEPCPVFLELSGVESTGVRIFLSGNLHTQSTTLYGVLLASEDSGKTWTEPFKRVRGGALEQIQFADLTTGWVSGETLGSLPRDPFLLLTTDGGKTWRQRPVFEDSRVGAISQFWFESKSEGELVVDHDEHGATRHEVFQSKTGGDSWEAKESTMEPVTLKGRKAETGWRLRADGSSKTFRLERRGASGWELVASFAIHVADCK